MKLASAEALSGFLREIGYLADPLVEEGVQDDFTVVVKEGRPSNVDLAIQRHAPRLYEALCEIVATYGCYCVDHDPSGHCLMCYGREVLDLIDVNWEEGKGPYRHAREA